MNTKCPRRILMAIKNSFFKPKNEGTNLSLQERGAGIFNKNNVSRIIPFVHPNAEKNAWQLLVSTWW